MLVTPLPEVDCKIFLMMTFFLAQIGPVGNSEDFQTAYGCPADSAMNRQKNKTIQIQNAAMFECIMNKDLIRRSRGVGTLRHKIIEFY